MTAKKIRKNFTLDNLTVKTIAKLAEQETEGNESLLIRKIVKEHFAAKDSQQKDASK